MYPRLIVTAVSFVVVVQATTVFDCRDFDCVTPFVRIRPPLPAPGSIPLPAGYAPCGPGNPNPICGTLTGLTASFVNAAGMAAGFFETIDRTLFFFNGVSTTARVVNVDFSLRDLAGNGAMLMSEGPSYRLVSPDSLLTFRPWNSPYFPPAPLTDRFEYFLSQFTLGGAGILSESGNAVRLPANRLLRLPLAGPFGTRIPFCEFERCTFDASTDVMIALNPSFVPVAIPEPGTAALLLAGMAAGVALRRWKGGR